MKDLAKNIYRQRLVIEGLPNREITDIEIMDYLGKLSVVLGMITVLSPVTHKSDKFGWAGWIHWETSGAHFYAWKDPKLFFSVDIYTCKKFNIVDAVEFTSEYFKTSQIEHKSF